MIGFDLALQEDFPGIVIPVNYWLADHYPVLDCLEHFLLQLHHIHRLAIQPTNYLAYRASKNIPCVPNIQFLDLIQIQTTNLLHATESVHDDLLPEWRELAERIWQRALCDELAHPFLTVGLIDCPLFEALL